MIMLPPDRLPTTVVNGRSLAFCDCGRGTPIVLVHGGVSDIRTWDPLVSLLSREHRVVSYSRRYAYPNEAIPDGTDDPMLPHVDDLTALLRALDATPAHLIGHSWGAFICLLTAIRAPDLVLSLVLMEPPVLSLFVSTPPRPIELIRVLLRHPRTGLEILQFGAHTIAPAQKAFRSGNDEAALRVLGRGVLGDQAYAQLSPSRLDQIRANLKPEKAQLLGAGFPPLCDDDVRRIRTPTLLMRGQHSPKLFHRLADHLENLLPDVESFEVPRASHIMHEDNPRGVSTTVGRFVASRRSV